REDLKSWGTTRSRSFPHHSNEYHIDKKAHTGVAGPRARSPRLVERAARPLSRVLPPPAHPVDQPRDPSPEWTRLLAPGSRLGHLRGLRFRRRAVVHGESGLAREPRGEIAHARGVVHQAHDGPAVPGQDRMPMGRGVRTGPIDSRARVEDVPWIT